MQPTRPDLLTRKNGRCRGALLAAAELAIELRRPPTARELSIKLGIHYGNLHTIVRQLARDGLIDPLVDREPHHPWRIVLTPYARERLELPLLVYIVWPLPRADAPDDAHHHAQAVGAHFAEWVSRVVPRAAPVSPYLVRHDSKTRPHLDAAAPTLALGCHAAIVYRDRMLAGRADAAAAVDVGLPTAWIDMRAMDQYKPSRGDRIWAPPYLLTR